MDDPTHAEALEIARYLINHGVPVFAAAPCEPGCKREGHGGGGRPGEYDLPSKWEQTVPSEVWLERWRPGWALAAVGGHVADFLDGDPRNGGVASIMEIEGAAEWPMTFGRQKTPSGGDHWIIAPTGLRKGPFMPGLDLQSGDENGVGRGFVWIAPTVRASKDPADRTEDGTGVLRAYRWEVAPDLEALDDYGQTAIDSTEGIRARMEAKRSSTKPRESASPHVPTADDPFLSASQAAGFALGDRSFSMGEAQDFVRPVLAELAAAQIGEIEETCNIAAATLSHFVPAFWSVDEAMDLLGAMLAHTAYDPQGPSTWTVEKFRPVLDGRRPPHDSWIAERKPEAEVPPVATMEAEPGEEKLTTLEKLRRKLVSAKELSQRPAPKPLIHGLLNLNTEAWMIGAPGSLKSFVALDMAGAVGAGRMWQGRRVEQGAVLYLAAEGETGMTLRTRAYIEKFGDMPSVVFLPYPVQVKSTDGQWDALVQLAAEIEPKMIIIDTQHRVSVGLEENSATDMGVLIGAIGRLKRATGACTLVIHHTGRNGGDARGSSALDGAQDTELKVVRAEPREALQCRLIQDKQKDMAEGDREGLPVQFEVVDLGEDPETGDKLSSLVVGEYDPFRAGQGITPVELDEFVGKHPSEWTKHVEGIPSNAIVQRRIVQVLHDHAHDRGLTEAAARKAVIARWYTPKTRPDDRTWVDGWARVVSSPLAINLGGQRWALDRVAVRVLANDHPDTPE